MPFKRIGHYRVNRGDVSPSPIPRPPLDTSVKCFSLVIKLLETVKCDRQTQEPSASGRRIACAFPSPSR
ncbi:hypothetical protein BDQ94DRAFT_135187 [Aspergillus welwitschiae]|uniref:Uncharacterized protein n=1 Tax=Aspergillus welwitschiae TaxID=1341132 RepID=A0A3F3QF28_9EURO|nr:hypothetical protein BDQ94DRAFT_135187 [Aspergillus welwitschiae]RDH37868.1 hypothetical protein BDQ94DRAFT_135187 [Aspergillus welwitschiae]